jgi:hypothetical protein
VKRWLQKLHRRITQADLVDFLKALFERSVLEISRANQEKQRAVAEMNRRMAFRDWLVSQLIVHGPWKDGQQIVDAFFVERDFCGTRPLHDHQLKFPPVHGFGV